MELWTAGIVVMILRMKDLHHLPGCGAESVFLLGNLQSGRIQTEDNSLRRAFWGVWAEFSEVLVQIS